MQYVIELKLWHGDEYNQRGEKQLADYLDEYCLKRGYMISFNFNKKKQVRLPSSILEIDPRQMYMARVSSLSDNCVPKSSKGYTYIIK